MLNKRKAHSTQLNSSTLFIFSLPQLFSFFRFWVSMPAQVLHWWISRFALVLLFLLNLERIPVCSTFAEATAYPEYAEHNSLSMQPKYPSSSEYQEILKHEVVNRLNQLGKVSDSSENLQRSFLSPASLKVARIIDGWMQDAGMKTWMDGMGNVHGRIDGPNRTAPALLIGSHMDTVLDAGKYDGVMGIVCAIAAVKALVSESRIYKLRRPIEIIAFSDEEGVRFQSTFLGSIALTGSFHYELLNSVDKDGISLANALKMVGLEWTRSGIEQIKYDPKTVYGYVEVHIEQGPVLEAENIPLGVVPAISGQSRLSVMIRGEQGHAGTVPMNLRRDAMAAAAAVIVNIENTCLHLGRPDLPTLQEADVSGLVCTVGEVRVYPGASNVIPGQVVFTVDIRAREDSLRKKAVEKIKADLYALCDERKINCDVELKHEAAAVECAPELVEKLEVVAKQTIATLKALDDTGYSNINIINDSNSNSLNLKVPRVISGAGHDAMAMNSLTKVGMLFIRCKNGISHTPEEFVDDEDIFAASLATLFLLRQETTP